MMTDQKDSEYIDLPKNVKEGDSCPTNDGGVLRLDGG